MKKFLVFISLSFAVAAGFAFMALGGSSFEKPSITKTEDSRGLRAGDIVFQSSNSLQCEAVKAATGSTWSHCGILLPHNGKLMVLEAVQPVQWEDLDKWIKRDPKGIYKVKRLAADSLLTDNVVADMVKYGEKLVGKNYDIYFNWSDDEWYCSELVWKIYEANLGTEVGIRKPLKDYNLNHPIVKEIMRKRYGTNPPLDEMMISPGAIFDCKILVDATPANSSAKVSKKKV
ncbi:MAG: YiiX family permuted papain-like enzyme [Flavobacteriales bacterium]